MPKCRKRRICREPDYVIFQSENGLDDVTTLTVDEYEAIRQIDMEGLSQEECAKKMCVARTTAQLIYNSARKKLPKALSLENPSASRAEITFYVMEVHAVKTAVNPRSQ